MSEVQFVNLTPHHITIRTSDGDIVIPPSGNVARVEVEEEREGSVGGIPVFRRRFGQVTGLPNPEPDKVFLVSTLVLTALGGEREDVLAPDTGRSAIRNSDGQIVAVTKLVKQK